MNTTTSLADLAGRIVHLHDLRGQLFALSREVSDAGVRTSWVRLVEAEAELLAEIDALRNQLETQRASQFDDRPR